MSKLLLYAKVSNKKIDLRSPAGNSDSLNILVESNTTWRAETTSDWLTLDTSSKETHKGGGVINFTYSRNSDKTLLKARTAFIKIVSSKNGYVLDTIAVKQHAFISGLRFTTDSAGVYMAPDKVMPGGAGTYSFYVYNPDPDLDWEILDYSTGAVTWASVNTKTGKNTTKITVTLESNAVAMARIKTIGVKYKETLYQEGPADKIDIIQHPGASDVTSVIAGAPGTWNADMDFLNVDLELLSTKYSGSVDESSGSIKATGTKKIRYSKGANLSYTSGYRIDAHGYQADTIPEKDPYGNYNAILAENKMHTPENFDVNEESQLAYNLEADASFAGVQTGAFTTYKGKNESVFSSHLIEQSLANNHHPLFKSKVEIFADDAHNEDKYTIVKNDEGITTHMEYKGDGLCTITLHNVFDGNRVDESSAFINYDRYLKAKDDYISSFPGGYDPISNSIPSWPVSNDTAELWLHLRGIDGFGIGTVSNVTFYAGKIAKDPVTITVKHASYLVTNTGVEHENGVEEVTPEYTYEVVSIGKYSDSGKTIPDNALYNLLASNSRRRKWKDDQLNMEIKVSFIDEVELTIDGETITHGPTVYKLSWAAMLYLSQKRQRLKAILKIILYVVLTVVLIIITWGVASYTAAWIYFIVTSSLSVVGWYNNRLNKQRNDMLLHLKDLYMLALDDSALHAGYIANLLYKFKGDIYPQAIQYAAHGGMGGNWLQRNSYHFSKWFNSWARGGATPDTSYGTYSMAGAVISIAMYMFRIAQNIVTLCNIKDYSTQPLNFSGGIGHKAFFQLYTE